MFSLLLLRAAVAVVLKAKVRAMLNEAVPKAKATLYAAGLAKLFVLEVGPLLTALLLCGRVGGAYAGEVAMMQVGQTDYLLLRRAVMISSSTKH